MAITAEQAAQLASTYQTGDTSGLQGLVNQMGVTQADVAQYFPGFDVGSLQGITLAPSTPAAPQGLSLPTEEPPPLPPTYGTKGITGDVISSFISANLQNPELIAQRAKEFGLSAADIQKAAGYSPEQQARYLSVADVSPTGISGLTPLTYGQKGQFSAKDVMDYINANISDPTRIYQAAQQYGVTPEQLQSLYAGSATPYGLSDIQKYFETGKAEFAPRYQDILESVVGTDKLGATDYLSEFEQSRTNIERNLGLDSGALKSTYNVSDFANKSIEDIEKMLQQSGANKYQEAARLSNIAKSIYGYTDEQAKALRTNLLKGNKTDETAKDFYNELLTRGYSKDLETRMLTDAAVRAPTSNFWKDNPELLQYYTPIKEIKSNPEGANQYGVDPKTGLPLISKKVAEQVLGNEVLRGENQEFRRQIGQDKLGADPHSAWAGQLARGVGIYGVKANNQDINYFDKIEKEIAKLGGIKTETDAENNTRQVVYKDVIDPETGQKVRQAVDVRSLFSTDTEDTGEDRYKEYLQTQDRLREAASSLGIDTSQYTSTKQAYDDLNKKLENKYLWQGRTDVMDPAAAKALGIEDLKDNKKHATILYEAVGDKLVPARVIRTFDFQDPNTTRGFFGDIATGIGSFLSIPPIQLALAFAGGFPALFEGTLGTAAGAGAAGRLATTIGTSLGLEGAMADVVGKALLNAGTSGLITGLQTGDLSKAGISALSAGIGSGVTGGLPFLLKDIEIPKAALKLGSEIAGGAAARAITGEDPGRYAINRLLSTGIGALASMGADKAGIPTKGPGADLFKAMVPIITSKKVNPEDLVRLATAVKAYQQVT